MMRISMYRPYLCSNEVLYRHSSSESECGHSAAKESFTSSPMGTTEVED